MSGAVSLESASADSVLLLHFYLFSAVSVWGGSLLPWFVSWLNYLLFVTFGTPCTCFQ
jgi:hypothetical protein